jgi:hypothetical protein
LFKKKLKDDSNKEMQQINAYLEYNLDDTFKSRYKFSSRKIKYVEYISDRNGVAIIKCQYQNARGLFDDCDVVGDENFVVAKAFKYECEMFWAFKNEFINYKLMSARRDDDSDKSYNLAQFIGYMHGQEKNHPFYASLMVKWYNFGNLFDFSRHINDRSSMTRCPNHLITLLHLSEQIADGN